MIELADLLDERSIALMQRWLHQLEQSVAPAGLTVAELRDHVPSLLRELGIALRVGAPPETSAVAREHGRQREALGFDVEALVREYGLLRDVILDAVDTAKIAWTPAGVRILTNFFSMAIAEGVSAHARHQARAQAAQLAIAQAAKAEAEAERQTQHALFMQAPVAIAIVEGEHHRYTFANPAYRALVGRQDLVGMRFVEAIPEARELGFELILEEVKATGQPFISKEVSVKLSHHANDAVLVLNVVYSPKRNRTGQIDGVLMSATDVTELVQARRETEAANRSKDEFLAMLGHELRNPLAPIVTALQLMTLSNEAAFAKERGVISRQVDHLKRLVDDLLDISRITTGKLQLARQSVDIATVVSAAVEAASPLLEERRHDVRVRVEPSLFVEGDLLRLQQVLANLLINAAKYTDVAGTIELSAEAANDEVILRVRDNGRGIDSAVLPRVFDTFAQGSQSLDRSGGGLGLGLAIVRTLVALHGGSVAAFSEGDGKGSEFSVRLPRSARPARIHDTAPVVAPTSAAPERRAVLIVDDNIDAAELLSDLLARRGYDIRVAHDGPSALAIVETFVPDVAILDIGLPVMDGYELANRLRKTPRLAKMKIVALTGYGQTSARQRSVDEGFDAHLVKPLEIALLEETLRS